MNWSIQKTDQLTLAAGFEFRVVAGKFRIRVGVDSAAEFVKLVVFPWPQALLKPAYDIWFPE